MNIAGVQLTELESKVLEKGLNFVPTPDKLPVAEFISAVESVCRSNDIPPDVANSLRFDVTSVLKSFHPPNDKNLTEAEWRALRDLQRRQDIVILPADKGRAVF